jgi:hypothetical protein
LQVQVKGYREQESDDFNRMKSRESMEERQYQWPRAKRPPDNRP